MTTGSWNKSSGNLILTKQWSGPDSPKDPATGRRIHRENNYDCTAQSGLWGGTALIKDTSVPGGWRDFPVQTLASPANVPQNVWSEAASETRALNRAISAFRNHDFNAGVALAEGFETVEMSLKWLKKAASAGMSLKRGNLAEAARTLGGNGVGLPTGKQLLKGSARDPRLRTGQSRLSLDDVASFWLEMRYGWVPLLSDIYGASQAYVTAEGKRIEEGRTEWHGHSSGFVVFNGAMYPTLWNIPSKYAWSTRVKFTATRELTLPESLGLNNPALIAWDLLPLSFVFDWAYPVADVLSAQFSLPPKVGTKYVVSHRTRVSMDGRGVIALQPTQRKQKNWWSRYKKTTIKRRVWGQVVTPLPSFTPPGDVFNAKRVGDSIALVKSLFFSSGSFADTGRKIGSAGFWY